MELIKQGSRYARISQSLLDWRTPGMPMTLSNMYELAIDINMKHRIELHESEPVAHWGTAVYRVEDDGRLVYVKDNFDTSG